MEEGGKLPVKFECRDETEEEGEICREVPGMVCYLLRYLRIRTDPMP